MAQAQKAARGRVRIGFVGNPLTPDKDDDPLVVASEPYPAWTLTISDSAGTELGTFDVWHPMDLISSDTLKVMSIERETRGADGEAYMQRIREQIQQIVPDLPDDVFERLTSRQLLAIGVKAWQMPGEKPAPPENPPNGDRDSGSSSRSPLVALDGATRS